MSVDVLSASARLIFWVFLMGAIIPRLTFGASGEGTGSRLARVLVAAQVAAIGLWLTDQLQVGAFVLCICVFTLGDEIRRQPSVVNSALQAAADIIIDLFYDPEKIHYDVAKDGSPIGESGMASPSVEITTPFDEVKAVARVFRRKLEPIADSTRHSIGPGLRGGVPSWVIAFSAAAGMVVAWLRTMGTHVLGEAGVNTLLQRTGWASTDGVWITNLAMIKMSEELAGCIPLIAVLALPAPIVFAACWSGASLLPRLSRKAHPITGAIAGGVGPTMALLTGTAPSASLLVACILPWVGLSVVMERRDAPSVAGVSAALAPLHPIGALHALTMLLVAKISGVAQGIKTKKIGLRTIVSTIGLAAGVGYVSGLKPSDLEHVVTPGGVLPRALMTMLAIAALWLSLSRLRRLSPRQRLAGQVLGSYAFLFAFASGGFDGHARIPEITGATVALVAMLFAIFVSDIGRQFKLRRMAPYMSIALTVTIVSMGLSDPVRATEKKIVLRRNVAQLASKIRAIHLPWQFTIIAGREDLPAFAGWTWFAKASDVPNLYPAKLYTYSRTRPEAIFGTKAAYVIIRQGDPDAEGLRKWISELKAREVNYPELSHQPELSDGEVTIFKITRTDEREAELDKKLSSIRK